MVGTRENTERAVDCSADFQLIFGSLDSFFDSKYAHKHITTVCFRGEKDAIVCLKALAAEVHNQRGFVDSNSRTSLLICNKQEREDGAPSWIFWEEDKAIQNTVPRIAVLVESSDLIELRKKAAFYLQCLNLIGKLFDEFGGDLD